MRKLVYLFGVVAGVFGQFPTPMIPTAAPGAIDPSKSPVYTSSPENQQTLWVKMDRYPTVNAWLHIF